VPVKVKDIVQLLNADVLSGHDQLEKEVKHAGASDMMSDILALSKPGMIILTGCTYPQAIRTALVTQLLGLIAVRGKYIPPETIELAKQNNFLLMRTTGYLYSSCGKLYALGLRGGDEKK